MTFLPRSTRCLSGTPPKVAVLNEGSVDVLTDYLFASGLGNTMYDIFQYITSPQIIAGDLKDLSAHLGPTLGHRRPVPVAAANRAPRSSEASENSSRQATPVSLNAPPSKALRGVMIIRSTTVRMSPRPESTEAAFCLTKTYLDANGRIETNGTTPGQRRPWFLSTPQMCLLSAAAGTSGLSQGSPRT